jgi:hypothetical protein
MRPATRLFTGAIALGSLLAVISPSEAVPAWTRKTGLDCNSCHFGGTNRLTKLGYAFLVRGHRLKGDEGIKKEDYKSLNLLEYASLANKVRYTANNADPSTAFDVEAFSLYTGGPLSKNLSYFVEYYFHETGGFSNPAGTSTSTTTNRSKLADAYLKYSSDPTSETGHWYARAGNLYPYLIYKASSGGRLSVNRPLIINAQPGAGNLYTARDRAYGVSAGWVSEATGLRLEAAMLNSAGTNARPLLQEKNNSKDIYVTLEKDLDNQGSFVGLYAYNGRFLVPSGSAGLSGGRVFINNWEDRFNRIGLLAAVQRENWVVSGGLFRGEHQLPDASNIGTGTPVVPGPPAGYAGGTRNPSGFYLEGGINLNPGLTGYARFDHIYNDLGVLAASRSKGATFGVSQRIGDAGRIVLEFSGYKNGSSPYSRQAQVELNWVF